MNKSTKKRDTETLSKDIENLGSSVSSDIEYDFSGFTLNCMTEYFDKSCEILSDIISNPVFDEKEIEKEKNLIIQMIKSRTDSIKQTANDKFILDFYGSTHPYSNIKYGKTDTIQALTRQDLIDAYNKVYSAKGITITVVGSIKKSKLQKYLGQYFSALNFNNDTAANTSFDNAKKIETDVVIDSKFNQAFILYAYDAPNVLSKDFVTLKLISSILGGRMTGRLFVELREKLGLAYEVSSIYPTRKDKSFFEIYIGLDKKNIDTAKKGIVKIMNDLCLTKIDNAELEDTKNFIKGVYLLDHQSVERQAYYLAFRQMMGLGYEYDGKYIEYLSQITSDDIIECANKYFKQEPYKLILMPN